MITATKARAGQAQRRRGGSRMECPEGTSCKFQHEHQHVQEFDHTQPKAHNWGNGGKMTGKLPGRGRVLQSASVAVVVPGTSRVTREELRIARLQALEQVPSLAAPSAGPAANDPFPQAPPTRAAADMPPLAGAAWRKRAQPQSPSTSRKKSRSDLIDLT